jgi:hypothetical protein
LLASAFPLAAQGGFQICPKVDGVSEVNRRLA